MGVWAVQADFLCEKAFGEYGAEGEFPIAVLVGLEEIARGLALLNKPPKWLLEYFEIGFVNQLQKISSKEFGDAMNQIDELGCNAFKTRLLEIKCDLFDLASADQLTGSSPNR